MVLIVVVVLFLLSLGIRFIELHDQCPAVCAGSRQSVSSGVHWCNFLMNHFLNSQWQLGGLACVLLVGRDSVLAQGRE